MCDLIWSDPQDENDLFEPDFIFNRDRNCSIKYGKKAVKRFLKAHGFNAIIIGDHSYSTF